MAGIIKFSKGCNVENFGADETTQSTIPDVMCKNTYELYRTNLWFPSMFHIAFGPGTEYCLRLRVRLAIARTSVPTGSTFLKDSRTLVTATIKQKIINLSNNQQEISTFRKKFQKPKANIGDI